MKRRNTGQHRGSGPRAFFRWAAWVCLALACAALLMMPEIAQGRAGGGHSYSGGRSSGGSGRSGRSSGGGNFFYLVFQFFRFCYYYPYIGLPIIGVIIVFFYYSGRQGVDSYRGSVIRRADRGSRLRRREEIIADIQAHDPAFDPEAFLLRVRAAFAKIQEAWSGQKLHAVRPFISDAVHERFTLQIDEQKAMGIRNLMTQIAVGDAHIVDGRSDQCFEAVSVRVAASAVDQDVSLADGRVLRGSSRPEAFVEVWTLARRRGAVTLANKPGLIEGNCPNCGGAIAMNQSSNCEFCKALLRSGVHDWVLLEITQECEWQPGLADTPPGVPQVLQRDPELNMAEIEDRASVVFWRRAAAERLNSSKPLRKTALAKFCDEFDQAAATRARGQRWYYGQCGVGSVDVVGISPAAEDDFDRALVEVRWSGTRMIVTPDGRVNRGEESAVSHLLMVLARQREARSNPDRSISSAHCPGCGAPESGGASDACEFCGAVLADGSKSWVLEETVALASPRAQELLRTMWNQTQTPEPGVPADGPAGAAPRPEPIPLANHDGCAPASALAWMVKMAYADGNIDAGERAMLDSVATRYGVDQEAVERLILAAQSRQLDLPPAANADEARSQLRAMAEVAMADGKLDRREYSILCQAGQGLGLGEHDVKQLLQKARSDIYARSKQILRDLKRSRR